MPGKRVENTRDIGIAAAMLVLATASRGDASAAITSSDARSLDDPRLGMHSSAPQHQNTAISQALCVSLLVAPLSRWALRRDNVSGAARQALSCSVDAVDVSRAFSRSSRCKRRSSCELGVSPRVLSPIPTPLSAYLAKADLSNRRKSGACRAASSFPPADVKLPK